MKNHSIQTALHKLIDTCYGNIDKGEVNVITMLDLSKGFDVIDRVILFYKLQKYGVFATNIDWFISYLTNRRQFVCVKQAFSKTVQVNKGVAQGTVLGPILFYYIQMILQKYVIMTLLLFMQMTSSLMYQPDLAMSYKPK